MSINRGQYGEVGIGGFQTLEELANLVSKYLGTSLREELDRHIGDGNVHFVGNEKAEMYAEIDLTVKVLGDQTIDGTKSFINSPKVPIPEDGDDTANKKYVDDLVETVSGGGGGGSSSYKVVLITEGRDLELTDNNTHLRVNSPTAQNITINDLSWPEGFEMNIEQAGEGTVYIVPGPGTTVFNMPGEEASTITQHAVVGLKYLGESEWLLYGALGWSG